MCGINSSDMFFNNRYRLNMPCHFWATQPRHAASKKEILQWRECLLDNVYKSLVGDLALIYSSNTTLYNHSGTLFFCRLKSEAHSFHKQPLLCLGTIWLIFFWRTMKSCINQYWICCTVMHYVLQSCVWVSAHIWIIMMIITSFINMWYLTSWHLV